MPGTAVVPTAILTWAEPDISAGRRLADDKQRLLRQSYNEGAQVAHLQKLLETSEGRNGALVEQTERAKARKVAAERRMHALDLHVERMEDKMAVHCSKQNQELQVRPSSLQCMCSFVRLVCRFATGWHAPSRPSSARHTC